MFGYVVVNPGELSRAGYARYREVYCGLCQCLLAKYGRAGRAVLAYDMAFLAMLLGAVYGGQAEQRHRQRCVRHPSAGAMGVRTEYIDYAADMNIALAYYKQLDDWNDEKSRAARRRAARLEGFLPDIRQRWPRQCRAIEEEIAALSLMEKNGETNPDIPANSFGRLMAELFIIRDDEHSAALGGTGAALGRFIYLADAVNDLKRDIVKMRYNPLVSHAGLDYSEMLHVIMGECTAWFEKLGLGKDEEILRNILYSGVWQKLRKA